MPHDPSLLEECFAAHAADGARVLRERGITVIAVVVVAAIVVGIASGSAAIALGSALLFALLALPVPLAIRSTYRGSPARLRRALGANPDAIVGATPVNLRVSGRRYRRVALRMTDGASAWLAVPDPLIARLIAAYPAREDFETLLARASR